MQLRPGTRLRSTVCATEIIVVRAPAGDVDLTCGGAPMAALEQPQERTGDVDPELASGTLLGKRYADEGLELLCTKPGEGSLGIGKRALVQKDAKALPASD
jgi:hypothetical protein